MAISEQLELLKSSLEKWNEWRNKEPDVKIDLSRANISGTYLYNAVFYDANLVESDFSGADLRSAQFFGADLRGANFKKANLEYASFTRANLEGANFENANLKEAVLFKANLSSAKLNESILIRARLDEADLSKVDGYRANFGGANLENANLIDAYLREADFRSANLKKTNLSGAKLNRANLQSVDLCDANLRDTNLNEANLSESNLNGCDFTSANLTHSNLIRAIISNVKISKSNIYGVNVWDLVGEFKEQKDLIITPPEGSIITVDNIKIAQFIYLILNNKEIRDVINTLTSKTVLILGRFAIPERKAILDALRGKLREYDLLPIVFDFDRPTDKDFTETIKTLAGISYFVIADVTNPKSSPLELQATVPDYQIPFVPIIQEGEFPFSMMVDLQKKYNWVLNTISYDSLDTLMKILKPHIIDPAIKKRDELRIIKATEPTIISGRNLLSK